MKLRIGLTLGAVAAALLLQAGVLPASDASESARRGDDITLRSGAVRVVDGDTIENRSTATSYRVVNIDTPETGDRARCDAERRLGNRAKQRVRALLAEATRLDIQPTGRLDHYGRTIAYVAIDGRDLGETLIGQHLARPWRGRREPWCDARGRLLP